MSNREALLYLGTLLQFRKTSTLQVTVQ